MCFKWILLKTQLLSWHAAAAAKSLQSCPTLRDPIDGLLPGSSVPGVFQARTLEWVAIAFSNAWKWKVKVKLLSRVWLRDPMDCSPTGSSIHGIFQARVLEWGAIAFSMDFTSFYLMSFFCSGIPSRMWHYMWSSGLFWLFLAMIFSHASHAFDDFSFEEYWLSILFNVPQLGLSDIFLMIQ